MNTITKALLGIGVATSIIAVYSFGFKAGDDDKKKKKTEKRIEIVEENGQTKVTVTTIEDGKKKVETYTGDEAQEFLNKNNHGNSTMHMSFDFDFDTTLGKNSFDFSMNGFGEEFAKEMEEMMKELQTELKESGHELNMSLDELFKSFDTTFSNGNCKIYSYGLQNGMQQLDSILNNGSFNFNFDFDTNTDTDDEGENKPKKQRKTVVIARSVVIEDVSKKKNAEKDLQVSDISFYPNPNGGNFSLRYKSESMDMIDIAVVDMQGRTVYNERISATGTILRNIELDQPAGTYILTLTQGKNKVSKKLIIE